MEGIMDTTSTKICSRCQQELPSGAFPKHAGHKDGLASQCRDCKSHADRLYRAQHRDELIAKDKVYYQEHREQILAPKSVEHLDPTTTYKICPGCEQSKLLTAFSLQRANV